MVRPFLRENNNINYILVGNLQIGLKYKTPKSFDI